MRVLVIGSFDSVNWALAACAFELAQRGHDVTIGVLDADDEVNNRAFLKAGFSLVPFAEIDGGLMDTVDFLLGAPIKPKTSDAVYRLAYERHVLVASFATLFSSITMRVAPDVVFALGDAVVEDFGRNHLRYRFVKTGNPQYDRLLALRERPRDVAIRRVLFIDQGGYPYGELGKRQLAETLIRIARLNPDVRIDVKARYSPGMRGAQLHQVTQHLYDYFSDAPKNIVLLDTPDSIEDMLGNYDAMLGMWSTAYLDAIVADMPLLLMYGFDSVDVHDVRLERIEEAFNHLEASGCLVRFDELGEGVMERFKRVDSAFARREVENLGMPAAPKVVSYLEHAYEELVKPDLRLPYVGSGDELLRSDSPEFRLQARYFQTLNTCVQEYAFLNRCMANVLDMSFVDAYYEAELPDARACDAERLCESLKALMAEDFLAAQESYFESAEGRERLERDAILQDFYFDWLYESGRYGEIERPEVKHVIAPESRTYNLARVRLDERRWREAYDLLFEYLHAAHASDMPRFLKFKRIRECIAPFRADKKRAAMYYIWLSQKRNRKLARSPLS